MTPAACLRFLPVHLCSAYHTLGYIPKKSNQTKLGNAHTAYSTGTESARHTRQTTGDDWPRK